MNIDEFSDKKQRAAEMVVGEVEERHRLRIHQKIRLTNTEINEETSEFLQRLAAASMKRAVELTMLVDKARTEVRARGPKAR